MSSKGFFSRLSKQWMPQWLLDLFKIFGGGPPRLLTWITFDDVPEGTMINTYYQDKGVTFSSVNTVSGNAYTSKWVEKGVDNYVVTLHDATQVRSIGSPVFAADQGAVKASFSPPKQKVSIEARGVESIEVLGAPDLKPFLEAFDAADNLLGKVFYPYKYNEKDWGSWQTLTIERPTADISYILFSSQANPPGRTWAYGGIYGIFDNLKFS